MILVALTYLFYSYFLPYYQIEAADIYIVLIRLLPIIIGFLLFIIALIIAPPVVPKTEDTDDEIPRDSYTEALYNLPDEQPSASVLEVGEKVIASPIQEKIISEQLSPVNPIIIEELKEVEKPVEVIIEEEIDSIEVIEPSIAPTQPLTSQLDRKITFENYLYPIVAHSEIAQLLEPIEESTPVDLTQYPDLTQTIELSLESLLEEELESGRENDYPVSLALCKIRNGIDDPITESMNELLVEKLELVGIIGEIKDETISMILPFYSYSRTQKVMATLISSIKKRFSEGQVAIGFTSIQNRECTIDSVIEEAHIAFELAMQKEGNSLIGFEKEEE